MVDEIGSLLHTAPSASSTNKMYNTMGTTNTDVAIAIFRIYNNNNNRRKPANSGAQPTYILATAGRSRVHRTRSPCSPIKFTITMPLTDNDTTAASGEAEQQREQQNKKNYDEGSYPTMDFIYSIYTHKPTYIV